MSLIHEAAKAIAQLDWDDKFWHYLLLGMGLALGSLIKQGFDFFAAKFWNTEYKAFRQWKKTQQRGLRDYATNFDSER